MLRMCTTIDRGSSALLASFKPSASDDGRTQLRLVADDALQLPIPGDERRRLLGEILRLAVVLVGDGPRRTVATRVGELGFGTTTVGRLLNHARATSMASHRSGSRSATMAGGRFEDQAVPASRVGRAYSRSRSISSSVSA